jgi:hypothetical protein
MRKVSLEHSPARALSASWAPDPRHCEPKKTVRVSSQNLLSQFFVPDVFVFRSGGLVALGGVHAAEELARPRLSLSALSHSALSTEAT